MRARDFLRLGPVLLCLSACSDRATKVSEEDFADEFTAIYCDLLLECACEGETLAACQSSIGDGWLRPAQAQAMSLGLEYDEACAGQFVDAYDKLSCDGDSNEPGTLACGVCQVYSGTKAVGESCSLLLIGSECRQGLVCLFDVVGDVETGFCTDPCALPGEGEACEGFACAEGLSCQSDGDQQICRRDVGAGESCADRLCKDDLNCASDEICRTPGDVGATCGSSGDCRDELECADGTCQPPPGPGEACSGYCREGAWCEFDAQTGAGLCRELKATGEPCAIDDECESNECENDVCTSASCF